MQSAYVLPAWPATKATSSTSQQQAIRGAPVFASMHLAPAAGLVSVMGSCVLLFHAVHRLSTSSIRLASGLISCCYDSIFVANAGSTMCQSSDKLSQMYGNSLCPQPWLRCLLAACRPAATAVGPIVCRKTGRQVGLLSLARHLPVHLTAVTSRPPLHTPANSR